MKIFLATDHAGFSLKEKIKIFLHDKGYSVEDCGAYHFDKDDDYPDFVQKAARAVSSDPENNRGIVIGASGQAEMMLSNKFLHVRCALFYAPAIPLSVADVAGRTSNDPFEMLRLTREHNNANMLSLGARFLSVVDACTALDRWLNEPFPGEDRHVRRIKKMHSIEANH